MYSAPVARRSSAFFVVGAIFVAAIVGLGTTFSNSSYGRSFASALLITAVALAGGILVVLWLFVPHHIEVDATEIRLIAPRSITRYVPAEMAIRTLPNGEYALVRIRTGRQIAKFRPADPFAAEAAFVAAGTQIVP